VTMIFLKQLDARDPNTLDQIYVVAWNHKDLYLQNSEHAKKLKPKNIMQPT
jgi:hypothetical protein